MLLGAEKATNQSVAPVQWGARRRPSDRGLKLEALAHLRIGNSLSQDVLVLADAFTHDHATAGAGSD